MELRIRDGSVAQRENFLDEAQEFLAKTRSPLRLSEVIDKKNKEKVLFLRERTWGEFFLEKLILTPQEMENVQNEALAAIELAFFPLSEKQLAKVENDSSKITDNYVDSPVESAGEILSKNFDDSNDSAMGLNMHEDECKRLLRSRVLDKDTSDIELQPTKTGHVQTFKGLLTVPQGISLSTCSALQVIAHNVVVSSVGATSVRSVLPYSALERALQAFESAFSALPIKLLPNCGERAVFVYKENLVCKVGLRHIQKLMCIPDDRSRNDKNVLAAKKQSFWESFYENCCANGEGSIVLEFYPDYYEDDPTAAGKRKAVYSEENIKGAIVAAVRVREEMRKAGKEPMSIMFAGMDQSTYTRVGDELMKVTVQSEKYSAKPVLNRDNETLDNFLTPEKFPRAAISNIDLQHAVRMVPCIRRRLQSNGLEQT